MKTMTYQIDGYTLLDLISRTEHSHIYRGIRNDTKTSVIIKFLNALHPSQSEVARFKQEYTIIKDIELRNVVKTYDFIELPHVFALIMEDFGGISLREIIARDTFTIPAFLEIAITLSETLGNIHTKKIIHRDINPDNILINPASSIIKITDFGIATIITHQNDMLYNPDIINGTLRYISPEQTGRMNRAVDYRTDLYSLGITLYEMLTGTVPFNLTDPMELIHAHIALQPAPPVDIRTDTPEMISRIIMKLLSKTAEERYQNAFGVMHDFIKCRDALSGNQDTTVFPLALDDIPLKFNIPQKLFGRTDEIDLLYKIFDRTKTGQRELVLVSGDPGIGKSALVQEIHKPVTSAKGYFLSGKFEQFRRDVPYSAIIQAFQHLIQQILTESNKRIQNWKTRLLAELENNANVIIDVIPEVKFITGDQPAVSRLGAEETQNRFNHIFKKFLRAFTSQDHPLVLFLDDLQWADMASLELIKMIITDNEIHHFLLIGAYRDNEIDKNDLFSFIIDDIKKTGTPVTGIHLGPLDKETVNDFISFFLRLGKDTTADLSALVHTKTNGNPFFVNQFIKTLYEKEKLKPSYYTHSNSSAGWTWDIREIESMKVTDNVVNLMADKITTLPLETSELLKTCSCMGNRFDLTTVSIVSEKPVSEILDRLSPAIDTGLIFFKDDRCYFLHDRIQEAAYSLLDRDKKEELHYKIGTYILHNTDEHKLVDNIFYIVNQLNSGITKITSAEERLRVAELNHEAGNKAKNTSAYQAAYNYLLHGIELLETSCWQTHYSLSLSLYNKAAEAAYLNKDFEHMDTLVSTVMQNAKTTLDKVFIHEVRIHAAISQNNLIDAVMTSLEALKMLGVHITSSPGKMRTILGLAKTRIETALYKPEKNRATTTITSPTYSAVMRIIGIAGYPIYYAMPGLMPFIVFESTHISLKHGIAPVSPFSYSGYGIILCGALGDIEYGYTIGSYALTLAELPFTLEFKARTLFVFNLFIKHWKHHARETLEEFRRIYKIALETGDIEYAAHAINNYCIVAFFTGTPLPELEKETAASYKTIHNLRQEPIENSNSMMRQVILNLIHSTKDPAYLKGDAFNEDEIIPLIDRTHNWNSKVYIFIQKTMICFLFKDYKHAVKNADIARQYLDSAIGTFGFAFFHFYDSLARLAVYSKAGFPANKKILRKVKRNQKKMKRWSTFAPMNHLHKYELVQAELLRITGRTEQAMMHYHNAAEGAHKHGYMQEEALAYELAGYFYLEIGQDFIAKIHLSKAYNLYHKWGALAKVRALHDEYPFLESFSGNRHYSETSDTSGSTTIYDLDVKTIINASHVLSSEIDLASLLEKLMTLSFKNAGAEKGYLLLINDEDETLYIQAEGSSGKKTIVMQNTPLQEPYPLPLSIINFVSKTGQTIVLDDACADNRFSNDHYIEKLHLKSVLCTPIIIKGKTGGIFYLENNLLKGAFTPSRLNLIRLLAAQAAISIENAKLVLLQKEKAALEKEIEMAQIIQQSLLPENIPCVPEADIAYKYAPMMAVGGDFVTIKYYDDTKTLSAFICDVTGHGVPAAITASMISHSLDFFCDTYHEAPAATLEKIGKSLNGKMGGNFFTAIMYSLNIETGLLTIAGAGHPHPVIIEKNGTTRMITLKGRLITDSMKINSATITTTLKPGDTIILYTDGITEIEDQKGVMLGEDDLLFCNWIQSIAAISQNPAELCGNIFDNIIKHSSHNEINDDVTILAVRFNG